MTRQEAQDILSAFRPGTDDERDPIFAEALELARTDPELKVWFDETRAFDQSIRADLARVIAPRDLRESILAGNKIIRPIPWWNRRLTHRQWAAAAAIALLGAVAAVWAGQRPASFGEFRREIADQAWGPTPHVEVNITNVADIRRSLDQKGLPSKFAIPPTLAQYKVRGYTLLHWHGKEMPMICFNSEGQHLHLVVVEKNLFPDAPQHLPETDKWEAWRTASWSRDDFSYVLTGLSTPSFVKKFRKSKRWDWEG